MPDTLAATTALPPRHRRPLAWLARLIQALAVRRRRLDDRQQLREMDEPQLRDIGLSRGDIERCFDTGFERRH